MADLVDLELGADGDLAFSTNLDLTLINREDRVRQDTQVELRTDRGEWFLDQTAGVPYMESILGTKEGRTDDIDSIIKAAMLRVDNVNSILAYESALARPPRRWGISSKVDTVYGPVAIEGVTI